MMQQRDAATLYAGEFKVTAAEWRRDSFLASALGLLAALGEDPAVEKKMRKRGGGRGGASRMAPA